MMTSQQSENFDGKLRRALLVLGLSISMFGVTPSQLVGQQPKRHFPPPNAQVRKIPAPGSMLVPRLNGAGETPSSENAEAPMDNMVRHASYENETSRRPVRDTRNTDAGAREYPWEYQLKHQDYEQFEQRLAEIWGDRLLCSALDAENRLLRIFLPAGKTAPEAPMRFDRVTGLLTYEGAPDRKQGWHELIQAIDRAESPHERVAVEVVDVGTANPELVRQVSWIVQDDPFEFGDRDERERVPNNQQDEPAIGVVPNPRNLPLDFENLMQDVPNLRGQVQIKDSPETNTIIIIGEPDDVAKVVEFINKLFAAAPSMQPMVKRIPLANAKPDEVVEQVQAIYDSQFVLLGPVNIAPDGTGRGVIVVGSPSAVRAAENLIKEFDGTATPVNETDPLQDSEKDYLIYRLKFLSATTAKRVVDEFFGQSANTQSTEPRDAAPVFTIVEERSNTLTVMAGPDLRRKAKALLEEIDKPGNENSRTIRVFAIRSQVAGDLAVLLQDILNGGQQQNTGIAEQSNQGNLNNQNFNQNQNQGGQGSTLPVTPITALQILGGDNRTIDGGILFDARLTSNNASNSIVVVAPEENMTLIAELIDQLDKLPGLESEVKVFQIYNGDALEILTTLQEMFNGSQQQGGQGVQQGTGQSSLSNLPLQSSGNADGTALLNLRFSVNARTNTIIASGSQSDLDFVDSLIQRLDEPDIRDRQTMTRRLSNAFVTDVAEALNVWLDERQTIFAANPLTGGGQASGLTLARREVIIVEVPASNTLIISARPEEFAAINQVITALDRTPPMIKVKAMIVQIDLDQLENFGIEFGLQDSQIFDANLNDSIGTNFVGLDNVAAQIVSDLGVGRSSSSAAGIGGFVLSAGDESLNFILRFLKRKGCASVLFSPQVMTVENLEGRFTSGASIQRTAGATQVVGAGVTQNVVDVNIGITLAVTPRVTPDGMIVMFVDVSNSSLGAEANGTIIGTDVNGNAVRSAPINQTAAQTTIMCRAGQTVALSGLISENKGQSVVSVPFLGDLPVIGPLFQSVENSATRSETLIILTPFIADGPDDLDILNQDDFSRMHWCECDVAEAYGNTTNAGAPYRERSTTVYFPDYDPLGNNPDSNQNAAPASFDQNGQGDPLLDDRLPDPNLPADSGWQNGSRNDQQRGQNQEPQFEGGASRSSYPNQMNNGYTNGPSRNSDNRGSGLGQMHQAQPAYDQYNNRNAMAPRQYDSPGSQAPPQMNHRMSPQMGNRMPPQINHGASHEITDARSEQQYRVLPPPGQPRNSYR